MEQALENIFLVRAGLSAAKRLETLASVSLFGTVEFVSADTRVARTLSGAQKENHARNCFLPYLTLWVR